MFFNVYIPCTVKRLHKMCSPRMSPSVLVVGLPEHLMERLQTVPSHSSGRLGIRSRGVGAYVTDVATASVGIIRLHH